MQALMGHNEMDACYIRSVQFFENTGCGILLTFERWLDVRDDDGKALEPGSCDRLQIL
ncbi:hypothetical protein AA3271_1516 [Gluconobacter japonicus NBRC 3271]|nr:hypothetical protein AA3271_1516 [Gluconobacter japonicus NBRC 3271]